MAKLKDRILLILMLKVLVFSRGDIDYAWNRIKLEWKYFNERSQSLPESDPYGTTLTRRLMTGFLDALGFKIVMQRSGLEGGNGRLYSISHTAENLDQLPIMITGFYDPSNPEKNTLDIRSSGGTSRFSPHAAIQEYLNVTEHLYGLATNGNSMRLMRDSGRLVKLTFIEFDLRKMAEEDIYSEFTILYRLLHASRFPKNRQETEQSWLEKYYQDSIESGNRIREGLSRAVRKSLDALGKGFILHPQNQELRTLLHENKVTSKDFFRELMRLIYRLLFLMVTEERDLIFDPDDKTDETRYKKQIYLHHYSITRLRRLSQNRHLWQGEFNDLWQGLIKTFMLFEISGQGKKLGINPLGGDLFSSRTLQHIEKCLIGNDLLFECILNLNEFEDENGNLVPINYRSIDVEELGSVYERLLDLHPVTGLDDGFRLEEGSDRKTTGSYYTRADLVNELIKSALIPVIEGRLNAVSDKTLKEKAILNLKICDAAAGSGHMLLAASRAVGWFLARIRSGEENPSPSVYHEAVRDVIQHCIYGVDLNPDAVELCKVALWLESHSSGKPLSFLDHRIRCGNSLVGVTDLSVLEKGIPDEAYNACTGDDKVICRHLKKHNKSQSAGQLSLTFGSENSQPEIEKHLAYDFRKIDEIPDDTIEAYNEKLVRYKKFRNNPELYNDEQVCNLWTTAFFHTYTSIDDKTNPTTERLKAFLKKLSGDYYQAVSKAAETALQNKFFHWPLEFPDVFEIGGFDVMLGNPPWERIKIQEQEFFATRNTAIALAPNKAARDRMIKDLVNSNPVLSEEFNRAVHIADCQGKFLRESFRYELTARGDINTYSIFAELFSSLINKNGRAGIVVPTGIATDDNNKLFFSNLIEKNRLVSLFDFENREAIFPDVHRSYKFCLLTLKGESQKAEKTSFAFFLTRPDHLHDPIRVFSLTKDDFIRLNPNTLTCPVFRTKIDAELTTKIYKRVPVLINEKTGENPWGAYYIRLVHYDDHSAYLSLIDQDDDMPRNSSTIYEPKMFWQFDHRFSSYSGCTMDQIKNGHPITLTIDAKKVSNNYVNGRYLASNSLKSSLLSKYPLYNKNWFILWRDVSNSTNERTSIATIINKGLASIACPGIGFNCSKKGFLLLANLNSIVYDYCARQKVSGVHYNWGILKQVPIITQDNYKDLAFYFTLRVMELVYTSWDIKSFADDIWKESDDTFKEAILNLWNENKIATGGHIWAPPEWAEIDPDGCRLPPFKWDEDRRAVLKADLDAIYAKLYGLTDEELRYILDPQDVYGTDFPGETFRVLKEKEIRKYGEYRTKRLVLEAWERLKNESAYAEPENIETKHNLSPMKEFTLNEGIYSVQDVVRITHLSANKVRRWFYELWKENYEGISSQLKSDIENMRISFHGLIELVVIGTLRENRFTLKKILFARNDLQSKTNKSYPFATNNVRDDLKVSGSSIIFNFPTGFVTLDGTGQYNLDFIKEFFKQIDFDIDGIAYRLFPLTGSKLVVIDPTQGGGKATISGKGVWVDTIVRAYTGGNSIQMIQDQYEVEKNDILAALEYSKQ